MALERADDGLRHNDAAQGLPRHDELARRLVGVLDRRLVDLRRDLRDLSRRHGFRRLARRFSGSRRLLCAKGSVQFRHRLSGQIGIGGNVLEDLHRLGRLGVPSGHCVAHRAQPGLEAAQGAIHLRQRIQRVRGIKAKALEDFISHDLHLDLRGWLQALERIGQANVFRKAAEGRRTLLLEVVGTGLLEMEAPLRGVRDFVNAQPGQRGRSK